jgi:solute carrier family 25 carnitine/acylcarnitine transporter 20/29
MAIQQQHNQPQHAAAVASPALSAHAIGQNAMAGLVGGLGLCLVGHPFETIKLRLQTGMYPGLGAALRGTYQSEGLLGFYAGVQSPLALSMVFRGWLYTSFHVSKQLLPEGTSFFLCGALTGLLASVVESPMLLLMNQVQARPGSSVWRRATEILAVTPAQGGLPLVGGLFQGLTATTIRNIPSNSLYLGFFHTVRGGDPDMDWYHISSPFVAGCLGGVLYWCFTYPLDVVRGCLQADNPQPAQRKYPGGWLASAGQLYKEGGVGRFYRGYTPCLLRAMPANGVFFVLAEWTKGQLA